MAIHRRGLRRIEVDGRRLVWRFRGSACATCRVKHGAVIADGSRRGSVLRLWVEIFSPDVPVTPAIVAARVREAIAQGWVPGEGAGVFAAFPAAEGTCSDARGLSTDV